MREGRSKDIIDMFFQNTVDIANIVLQSVEDGFSERKLLLTIAPALRAARRVITRSAQIALAAGSVDEAVRKFEYASFINAKMHRPFLTGDAARRYIEALVRVRNTYPSAMKIAREVLQANLDLKAVEGTKSQRQSNDLIALLVTDAMLDRVEGRIDECSNKLSKLAEHEFVRSGEAPYAAIQELRLETIRLRISREDIRSDLDKEIRFFSIMR